MTRKLLALTLSLALTAGLAACSTQAPAEDTAPTSGISLEFLTENGF